MSFLRSAATNTLYQVISKVIALISGILVTRLLTQTLTPTDYGLYTLVTNLVLLTVSLTEWGTGFIAVRAASQKKFDIPLLFGSLFVMRLCTVFLGFLVLGLFAQINFLGIPAAPLYISISLLVPLTLKNVFQSFFQYLLKFKYIAWIEIIGNVGYLLLLIYFQFNYQVTLDTSLVALTLVTTAAMFVSYLIATQYIQLKFKIDKGIAKYLFKESAPLGAQLLLFSVYNRLDTYILQYFKGESDVALYGLAYKMYSHLVMGAAFVMNAVFPEISKIGESEKIKRLYSYCFHFLLLTGISLTLFTIIFAGPLINLINSDYVDSIFALQLLAPALVFAYLNHLTGYTLVARHKQQVMLWTSIIALALNSILNIIYIPQYSFYASSIITVITEASMFLMTSVYLAKNLQLTPQLSTLPQTIQYVFNLLRRKFQ